MRFIEIIISIHLLLLVSSFILAKCCLFNEPSFKLKMARLLLISCVFSPIVVQCIPGVEKPKMLRFVSLETVEEYVNQPIINLNQSSLSLHSFPLAANKHISGWQIFWIAFCSLAVFRSHRLLVDLRKLKLIVHSAIPYRNCGRVAIQISHHCHIPFSLRLLNKAYIILPVSLLSSSKNIKIAIAHEGQHHRNGDCLWVYFIELIRIVFFWNPGVTRWHRILNELQEFSCDEVLVGRQKFSPYEYGRCLFEVVQTVSQYSKSSEREIACTVGMALSSNQQESRLIIRRISMLPKYHLNSAKQSFLGLLFAGIVIGTPICGAYAGMGSLSESKNKSIDTSFIDSKIQHIAADEITAFVKQYHAQSGVIAIADPASGKIIAFAEAGNVNGEKSWKSRIFAPGSTIKPFVAAAAVDSGVVSENKIYDCHSPYFVDGVKFTNSSPDLASVSVTDAIAKSVNICIIKVAQDTGVASLREKLAGFGFDMTSWWQKNKSDSLQLATVALGENIPVNLETLTKSYAVLANKGKLFSPNSSTAISASTAKSVTHMLKKAVEDGTGTRAAIAGVAVAGKTGTLVSKSSNTHLALFGGYVPADNPRYVIVVAIEDGYSTEQGETSNSGGALAAPVFKNVAVKSLNIANK